MSQKSLKELKEELRFVETHSIYTGDDGMPSLLPFIIIFATGIIPGIILLHVLKSLKIRRLRKKISMLENQ